MTRRNSAWLIAIFSLVALLATGVTDTRAADISWIDSGGGNWSDTANWDSGTVPGPTDNAFITLSGTYTVVIDVDVHVTDLTVGGASGTQTLIANSRVVTIDGTLTLNGNGAFDLNSSTLDGTGSCTNDGEFRHSNSTVSIPVTNQAYMRIRATVALNGTLTTTASSLIDVEGSLSGNGAMNVAASFTNNGLIQLTNSFNGRSATLNVVTGTFTNGAAGQVVSLTGSGGGSRTLACDLDNDGTITVSYGLSLSRFSGVHINNGDINLVGADMLVFQLGSSPTFTNSGNISIGSGQTFTVDSGTYDQDGGTMTGSGTALLDGVTADLTTDLTNDVTLSLEGGTTVNGPGTLINNGGGTVTQTASTVNADVQNLGTYTVSNGVSGDVDNQGTYTTESGDITGDLQNSGTYIANGTNAIGSGTNLGGGLLRVESETVAATLTVDTNLTNNADVELTSTGTAAAELEVVSGTLTSTGTVTSLVGGGGARTLDAQLDNQGTIDVLTDLVISKDSAAHSNSGTINVTVADLDILMTGGGPSFASSGTIEVGSGRTLLVSGGIFENAAGGLIFGTGTLDVSATTFVNNGDVNPGTSPGILTVTGDYAQTTPGELNMEVGGYNPGTNFDRIDISGNANLGGTLDLDLIGGFEPTLGDTFRIMNYGSFTGSFDNATGIFLPGGLIFDLDYKPDHLTLLVNAEPDTDKVFAFIDEDACISTVDTCVTIPFVFTRIDNTPVRGVSVTFQMSSELRFCAVPDTITQGPYMDGYNSIFQVLDNGGGSYTIDQVILGDPCGPTAGGVLFNIRVTSNGVQLGTGTLTVTSVTVRDCSNQPLPGLPGAPGEITINFIPPTVVSDLSTTQIKTGNDASGLTPIQVNFTDVPPGHYVRVFRKGYGDYPEYDDGTGAVPSVPADTLDALANGWVATDVALSGDLDSPPTRDYWYYVAFVIDPCINISAAGNLTDGTLNYHLGDVSDGVTPGQGNNEVFTEDISLLGSNYGTAIIHNDPVNYLDVGPTDDFTVDGLPTTDNLINFDDLILFGVNFGVVSMTEGGQVAHTITQPSTSEEPSLVLESARLNADQSKVMTLELRLEGNETAVKGFHSVIDFDREHLNVLSVTKGSLIEDQAAPVFFTHLITDEGLVVDAVALGTNATIQGSGVTAVVRFEVEEATTQPQLIVADMRDAQNGFLGEPVDLGDRPASTEQKIDSLKLLGARPNPFDGSTIIAFRLPTESAVSLKVFDIQGRLVRTLYDGKMPAGEHSVRWDGRNDVGHGVSHGVYLYTFRADGYERTRKLFLIR